MEQNEKIGLFHMLQIAVAKPKEYYKALNVKKGTIVLFVMTVSLLILFLGSMIPVFSLGASIGGPKHFITETLPEFQYKNGVFSIEKRIEIESDGFRLIVDSDVDHFTKDDLEDDTSAELLISKNNMRIKNTMTAQNLDINFSDMGKGTFDNQDLVEMLPFFYLGLLLAFVFMYITILVGYLVGSLIIALFGRSIGRMMKQELPYRKMYIFALMARMTAGIVNNMGIAAGISFFQSQIWTFLEFAVIMGYLYFGIKGLKEKNRIGI